MVCGCFGGKSSGKAKAKQYSPDEKQPPQPAEKKEASHKPEPAPVAADFKHMPEPILQEITNYVKQRGSAILLYPTLADVRAELLRNVNESIQQVDIYPKGRQMLNDDEYMAVMKDLLNLSNILDDMEQTGVVPYTSRTQYYNLHSKLHRLLIAKAK
ncbi:hypothetical protein DUNSADRAFT_2714 [Dunaliella salina]|uniref:Uncharacterized protein n=1 Tax=Dunaliella salina TaxID=3046 RepID=A0ABQ7GV68_DUNSA|nr:hypothetical protein DUNSADRAFT_2714 [Dunaliella salina]|eukprot:KAF5838516.1 hypothetical protein DUNSADRAFT_2714 [Dunaliella salina]